MDGEIGARASNVGEQPFGCGVGTMQRKTGLEGRLKGAHTMPTEPHAEAYNPDSWAYLKPAWAAGFSRAWEEARQT